jgi:polyhydroxyalkanoate synthesis regulator phasin
MANSGDTMARFGRLETRVAAMAADVGELKRDVADLKTAAWKTAEILTDHSERLGGLQRTLDERLGAVTDRLDRLIAVTIQERTGSTERLGEIERRLARLEERAGI